jgi:hypothetical protein
MSRNNLFWFVEPRPTRVSRSGRRGEVRQWEERGAAAPVLATAIDTVPGREDAPVLMTGHFAVFNQWTEIRGADGDFLERMAPGAFKKTLRESAGRIRVQFQHGRDPSIGDKPIGVPVTLREDSVGAYYSVALFTDASYVADLLPALRAGQLGSSFRFQTLQQDRVRWPKKSDYNPTGLEERTVKEARLLEFGPVVFPAYQNATANVGGSSGGRADLFWFVDAPSTWNER